jgi:mannose-6-phosphate isomerase-like protein (cupin superfamily)
LIINPGEEISNQFHNHRNEHWILVSGSITVFLEEKKYEMQSNEHLYIPKRSKHQIINPFDKIAVLIEVQSGSILQEDDIVRLSDKYQRDN